MFIDPVYAEEEAHEATTTAESGSPLSALGINSTLFFFQLINFAIVATIIWFLILKPLTKKMTERQKMIDESINNAKAIQDNLQKSEQKYQERIDIAKVEANKIIDKAAGEAEKVSADLKVKAKNEIESLVEQAKQNIRVERDTMVGELREQTVTVVVAALEKILSEKIDSQKDKEIIQEMVKKIK
jgi:F-type H+-transporting ATPase subunit b